MAGPILTRRRVFAAAAVVLALALVAAATLGAVGLDRAPADTPEEQEYRSIVIFRNDDIQPNYRTETMRAVDRIFVEEDVPVTQAVIPMLDERPVTDSEPLCDYLRQQRRDHPGTFEFALHGYSHAQRSDLGGASEFGGLPASTQREHVRDGTRILTECTGERPRTFVPPFNTYDDATVDALVAANYTTISSIGWFERQRYDRTDEFVGELHHVPATAGFVDWSTGELREPAELRAEFDAAYENGSVYVQMLHYTSFETEEKRDRLRSFVRYTKSREGVGFVTLGEFAEARAEGRLTRTDDGWRYRPEPEPVRSEPTRALCSTVGERWCSAADSLIASFASARTGVGRAPAATAGGTP